MSANLEMRNTS